ncbi:transporter substrate-binding domain-containing protein [Vibrio quintilis]|uniref:Lysine-arginine-ornithine-binding periplasmic protein n=1 Tax=Vibrio quintilis TaxID=1117707 RepID=A0A1M7YW97_9VIBR|nr:transporter substrate-binding domain-containing protein [Vibrio quintilis]SHO56927.1 Lysine-arginine-ornithine-binding periplasmic protein precursor [Vibrio quintilis]
MIRKIACLLLALTGLTGQTSAFAKETIRIGVDATYPPFEYTKPDGTLAGFEIELGNAMCEKVQAECVWVPMSFDGLIPALKVKKIDAVFSSLGISEKRKKVVDFSDRTWTGFSSMLSLKRLNLQPAAESLKGKVLGVLQGSIQEDFARKKLMPHGVSVQAYQTQEQVYADLLNGRIDASMQDMTQAQTGFIEKGKHPEFANQKVVDELLPADSAIAIRKGDSRTMGLINRGISAIHADGTYDRIQRQFFGDLDLYNK